MAQSIPVFRLLEICLLEFDRREISQIWSCAMGSFMLVAISGWSSPFDPSKWSIAVDNAVMLGNTVFLSGSFWDDENGINYKFMKLDIVTNAYELFDCDSER
jgi:hypothetical protein